MRRPRLLNFILASLSGYVDTAVFVHMGGLFVAHVTGNFVLLGVTLSRFFGGATPSGGGHHGDMAALQFLSFPLFVVAAGCAAMIAGRCGGGIAGTRMLFRLVTVILAGVAGCALVVPGFAAAGGDVAGSLLLVVAMAALNAAHRLDPTMGPPFTVMTGNVTSFAIGLARFRGRLPPETVVAAPPVAGFLVGCLCGAFVQTHLGMGAMIVPAVMMGIALLVAV